MAQTSLRTTKWTSRFVIKLQQLRPYGNWPKDKQMDEGEKNNPETDPHLCRQIYYESVHL